MESSGFVIIDSEFRPLYANEESIKILGYPNLYANLQSIDGVLTQKSFLFCRAISAVLEERVPSSSSRGEGAITVARLLWKLIGAMARLKQELRC